MAKNKADIVNGSMTRTIFTFTIPLIVGTMIQVLFNMADQVVLGQMAGTNAVASVGACGTVTMLIVNFFCGLAGGVTILLARAIGAGDDERSGRILSTAVISACGVGLLGMTIALPLAGPLLRLTECPADCFDGAALYLRIYYSAVPAIVIYNFGSAVLRVSGDSQRPMYYLIFAGALNVVLNVILCLILTEKVAAVAIATMVSQALGAVLVIRRLFRMEESWHLRLNALHFDGELFGKMLRYGIPNALNSSLFCIANLQTQAAINSFGTEALAGYSAACNLGGFPSAFSNSFAVTTMTMVGQNLGAQKRERVNRSFLLTLFYSSLLSEICGLGIFLFRYPLLGLYVPESRAAVEYGIVYLIHVTALHGICAAHQTFSSYLNAFGYTTMTLITSIFSTIVFRTIWIQLFFPLVRTFAFVMATFTIAWLLCFFINGFASVVVHRRYQRGLVRKL